MQKLMRKFEFGKTAGADGLPLDPRQIAKQSEGPVEMLKRMLPSCKIASDDRGLVAWLSRNGK